jgi:DNA repair exonuclease SbcCD ATPase subunit
VLNRTLTLPSEDSTCKLTIIYGSVCNVTNPWQHREGVNATPGLIEEVKELINKNAIETKTHMKEVLERIRELDKKGNSISNADRARWDELQIEKEKCEKEIAALEEVSKQLQKIELSHLESVLNDEKIHQNVHRALGRSANASSTVLDVQNFITKLPPLMHEVTTRRLFVEREQEAIGWANKEMRDQMRARLEAEKKADESCMQNLDEVTKKINKSASVLRNVRGAEDADQIFVSNFDQLLHCKNISTGRRGRVVFGTMTEESLKSLCRTRETPASPSAMKSSVLNGRENLLLLCFIGLLAIIGFNDWVRSNHV